jgi:hypothetical protein
LEERERLSEVITNRAGMEAETHRKDSQGPSLPDLHGPSSVPAIWAAAVFVFCCVSCAYIYANHFCGPPIRSDGYGYYAYLPSLAIDHNLDMKTPKAFGWTVVGTHPLPYVWDGITPYRATGKLLDKYTIGTALLQAPFFLAANFAARPVFKAPADGYSWPYQAANALAGIVYFTAGAYLLLRLLLARFDPLTSGLTALAVLFATSAVHYASYAASFSHAYSFFLVALLAVLLPGYQAKSAGRESVCQAAAIGLVLGLIAITRVTNVVIVVIPFVVFCEKHARNRNASSALLELVSSVFCFLLVCSLQIAYWHARTRHFLVNSYQGEYFNWGNPQLMGFMFSVKAGLFFWAPVLLFSIFGFPGFVRKERLLGLAVGVVLLLEIYICSSWWSWWFGANYGGARPMVDMLPLVALPLGYGVDWFRARLGLAATTTVIVTLVGLNLFLMISRWHNYIPWTTDTTMPILLSVPGKWL